MLTPPWVTTVTSICSAASSFSSSIPFCVLLPDLSHTPLRLSAVLNVHIYSELLSFAPGLNSSNGVGLHTLPVDTSS